jgi:hypothetical protein
VQSPWCAALCWRSLTQINTPATQMPPTSNGMRLCDQSFALFCGNGSHTEDVACEWGWTCLHQQRSSRPDQGLISLTRGAALALLVWVLIVHCLCCCCAVVAHMCCVCQCTCMWHFTMSVALHECGLCLSSVPQPLSLQPAGRTGACGAACSVGHSLNGPVDVSAAQAKPAAAVTADAADTTPAGSPTTHS